MSSKRRYNTRHVPDQCRYSGVAWARSTRPDTIQVISGWDGHTYHQCRDKEKVPSLLSYDRHGKPASWGYSVAPPEKRLKWFKLLLIDEGDLPDHLKTSNELLNIRNRLKSLNKEPVEVIADYLRLLWSHAYGQIQLAMGTQFMGSVRFKIVITLPAIWPPYAQIRMREAATLAGLLEDRESGPTSLTFVSEPEAAALASMDDMSDRSDIQVRSITPTPLPLLA